MLCLGHPSALLRKNLIAKLIQTEIGQPSALLRNNLIPKLNQTENTAGIVNDDCDVLPMCCTTSSTCGCCLTDALGLELLELTPGSSTATTLVYIFC